MNMMGDGMSEYTLGLNYIGICNFSLLIFPF